MGMGLRRWLEGKAATHGWLRRGLLTAQLHAGDLFGGCPRHPIDRTYGIRTQGRVPLYMNRTGSAVDDHIIPYGGCVAGGLRLVLAGLPVGPGFHFLDLGCGKGRALVVATEWAFDGIVGVELSAEIAAVARANGRKVAHRFPDRTPIEVRVGDASAPALPPSDLVVFLYHPFARPLVARLAAHLAAASTGRTIFLVYENPVHGEVFDGDPRFRRYDAVMIPCGEERSFSFDAEEAFAIWSLGAVVTPSRPNRPIRVTKPGYRAVIDGAGERAPNGAG